MAHISTAARGRRYRYYVCAAAGNKESQACRQQRVPALVIEQSVVRQIDILVANSEREEVRKVLRTFGPKWESRSTDQRRLRYLIERITYDGATGRVTLRLRQGEEKHD